MAVPDLSRAMVPRTSRALRDQGLSKHRLDGPRYRRTSPGRYVPAAVPLTTTQRLVEAAAHLPTGAALGGWAAGHLLGAVGFDGRDGSGGPLPVTMCVPGALHRRAAPGLRYVRADLGADDVVLVGAVPVTAAVRTACDLARSAPTVEDAVVDLDRLLLAGVIEESEIALAVDSLRARRGTRQARAAFALARRGARSPGETRLRLTYVLGLGAPTPLLNPRVLDDGDHLVGIPDLLDEEAGLVMEYDGSQWQDARRPAGHLDPEQHREDNVREEGFERHGLIVVRSDRLDLSRHRAGLVSRLGAARADGLVTRRRPRSWYAVPERYPIPVGDRP